MAGKVRGVADAKASLDRIINDVRGIRVVRALQSALFLIGTRAAYYTPVDTSTLLNSQFREVNANGTIVTGRIGYSAAYAVYVHNASGKLKGQPRAHFGKTREGKEFGGGTLTGRYWDPHGEPKFLTKGAEEERESIDAVMLKEMKL